MPDLPPTTPRPLRAAWHPAVIAQATAVSADAADSTSAHDDAGEGDEQPQPA